MTNPGHREIQDRTQN